MAKAEFEKSQPVLVEKKTELVEVLERLRTDPATSNEKIAEYENLIKNTEYQIISLQNRIEAKNTSSDGGATWYDGASESINNYLEELQKLTPESATVEVKTLIDQVSKSIDKEYSQYSHINRLNELNTGLFNAQEYFRTATEQAKEWQASAVNSAKENIQSIQNYWAAQKDATQENITSITNQYIAQGTDPVLARQWAESKFGGALPQLIAQEKAALEGALQWYESVNQESLSDIAISKFGLDQVQDKIEFIEKELNSLTKPGTE
jgi:chromosome segregation ATPase